MKMAILEEPCLLLHCTSNLHKLLLQSFWDVCNTLYLGIQSHKKIASLTYSKYDKSIILDFRKDLDWLIAHEEREELTPFSFSTFCFLFNLKEETTRKKIIQYFIKDAATLKDFPLFLEYRKGLVL